jgi:hypothetical protein
MEHGDTLRDWVAAGVEDEALKLDDPDQIRAELAAAARRWRIRRNDDAQQALLQEHMPDELRIERLRELLREAETLKAQDERPAGA